MFGRLLKDVLETSTRINLNFDHLTKKWNTFCEGERVFYKTLEHLEKYCRHWKEQKLARTTHQAHYSTISPIESQICEKNSASVHLPSVVPSLPKQNNSRNLLAPINIAVPKIPLPERVAPDHHHLPNYHYNSYYYRIPAQIISVSSTVATYKTIRTQERQSIIATPYHPYSNNSHALKKTCKGCGNVLCNGKMRRSNCKNPICLKCKSKQCEGVWDKMKCQNPTSIN